ncbi:MAG: hypothetical protein J6C42_03290, partial [Clostridia bacterium]|nr:hypothetical protein [Clostridia bacterium]
MQVFFAQRRFSSAKMSSRFNGTCFFHLADQTIDGTAVYTVCFGYIAYFDSAFDRFQQQESCFCFQHCFITSAVILS